MNARAAHSMVGRGDLLRALQTAPEQQHVVMARLFGFVPKAEGPASPPVSAPAWEGVEQPVSPPVTPPPLSDTGGKGPAYYRITDHQGVETSTEASDADFPQWFLDAQPTLLEETCTRIPPLHRKKPEVLPLVPWSRLWPFLLRVLGAELEGKRPDLDRLTHRLANGEQVRRIPRVTRWTWAAEAVLLVDINSSTFPFRQDFFRLRAQLRDLRGAKGLHLLYLLDAPGGAVEGDDDERPRPWRTPDANIPLLILSDLGVLSSSRQALNQWLTFGRQLRRDGQRPVVLMPVAPRQVDRRLLRFFCCVVWDQTGNLRPVTGAELPAKPQETVQNKLDDLLALHFPAVRSDMVLTRSLCRLFPATQLDVGYEGALWQHKAVLAVGDDWGWRPEERQHSLDRFRELCLTLSPHQQHKLVEGIGRHHAQFADELYFEAMDRLLQFGLPVPEEVQAATRNFFETLVKTYHAHPNHLGLDRWVRRCLARNDQEEVYANHDHFIACRVLERIRHQADQGQIHWPASIPAEKLWPFIKQPRPARVYYLRQWGQLLELSSATLMGAPLSNWSRGATLLQCTLTDSTILFRHRLENGQEQQISLQVPEQGTLLHQLPPGSGHQMHIGRQWLTLEALRAGERFPWAPFRGVEQDTFWVETVDAHDQRHRWYWNPPVLHDGRTWRGFWYALRLPESVPLPIPPWADACQRDQCGLRVRAQGGIAQWFRWIEPGSFLMGSPEDELQRNSDELQHEVRLSQGFWLGETTVTQALWMRVMGENPSRFQEDAENPVEQVSWQDAQTFLDRLHNLEPSLELRLPTEAEWEYACRGGGGGPFWWGGELSPEQANYNGNYPYAKGKKGLYRKKTLPGRSFAPNPWGLYQMHGNVWEWCADWYGDYPSEAVVDPHGPPSGDFRVLRGGSWGSFGGSCRSACRRDFDPSDQWGVIGFRLARGHQSINQAIGKVSCPAPKAGGIATIHMPK